MLLKRENVKKKSVEFIIFSLNRQKKVACSSEIKKIWQNRINSLTK